MIKSLATAVLVGSLFSAAANATVIFEDNFNSEAGPTGSSSLNYNSFANWTVSDGTVDVVSNGGWGIQCAGSVGKCVDLDGSTGNAGKLTSSALALDAGEYVLSFDISGNQRNGASDSMAVTLSGFFNQTFNLLSTSPWTTISHSFTVSSLTLGALVFNHGGGDNVGIMLDNVKLVKSVSVPEPGTLALLGLGLVGLSLRGRKTAA